MRVIGTAGHVDHGKSSLVAALTGINPDRLKEEQLREMTIDLGFAWLTLPNNEEVGVVDVPGHRDFVENMLAGVGGIDAALFVIAADEGVMPQTREHLAIVDILQIKGGVIALTKTDLVKDPDWLDLVELDVGSAVKGTVLENAPLVRVSARTGEGLSALIEALSSVLAGQPPRPDFGRARLPIDRVFTIAGFGTVVTGTLTDGRLKVGDEVELLPRGARGRIRGLQSHKRQEQTALPGSRTAVNISGLDLDEVRRGDVLAHTGVYRTTRRLDVQFRLLPDVSAPLKHSSEVKFFLGAAEIAARVRVLGTEELLPGQTGWLQIELKQPVAAVRGDRYILRRPSPGETLGGGVVVEPLPVRRHKRFAVEVIDRLETLVRGTPAEVFYQAALAVGAAPAREMITRARLAAEDAGAALQELIENHQLIDLDGGAAAFQNDHYIIPQPNWTSLTLRAIDEINAHHQQFPLRRGMPREALKSRLKLPPRLFALAVDKWAAEGVLADFGAIVARPEHRVRFTPQQQVAIDQVWHRFSQSPYSPPSIKEIQADLGEEVCTALIEMGELVMVSPEVAFRQPVYQELLAGVKDHLQKYGTLTVAQFRDRYQTSRRYALALLEHLDIIGVTMRQGDERRLRR